MIRACGTRGREEICTWASCEKPRRKKEKTLGSPRHTSEDIQLCLKRTMLASRGQASSGLGSEQVVISSEHGNDDGGSIKRAEFD